MINFVIPSLHQAGTPLKDKLIYSQQTLDHLQMVFGAKILLRR